MKKISTAAAKQSRNFSQQKLTIGLDLAIIGAGTACWMNKAKSCWSRSWAPLRKR